MSTNDAIQKSKRREPKGSRWKSADGFRLIPLFDDKHNAERFRWHFRKVQRLNVEHRQWRKRMARRIRLARSAAAST